MIQVNDLAFIKSSGEQVFVLKIEGSIVTVRRPDVGQNGCTHVVEDFTVPELESPTEREDRELAMYARRITASKAATSAATGTQFAQN